MFFKPHKNYILPRNEELRRNTSTIVDIIYYIDIIKLSKLKIQIKTISH